MSDYLIYILIAVAVVVVGVAIYLVLKSKGGSSNSMAGYNANYNGPRKSVTINDFGTKKLEVIKCVREATGMSLINAKNIVEGRGTIEALPEEVAEALVSSLKCLGASAEVKK